MLNTVHNDQISYFQPLNERLRTFLRLNFLFRQAKHNMQGDSLHDSHDTLITLMEIIKCVNQQDFKKEVLKELERVNLTLAPLQDSPDIKHNALDEILSSIKKFRKDLLAISGPFANELKDDEFLKSIQQRNNIPGGLSEYEPPIYQFWLKQSKEYRAGDYSRWFSVFDSLDDSIDLIINMIIQSATPKNEIAYGGSFQQSLDTKVPYQMVVVSLPEGSQIFPEISGGKHRFSIRFMDSTSKPRPVQTENDIEFELSCCAL